MEYSERKNNRIKGLHYLSIKVNQKQSKHYVPCKEDEY